MTQAIRKNPSVGKINPLRFASKISSRNMGTILDARASFVVRTQSTKEGSVRAAKPKKADK